MKHTKSRLLSLVLAIGMIVSLFPSTALAEGETPPADVAQIGEIGYPTLAAAVEAAESGDTISIAAGTYEISLLESGSKFEFKAGVTYVGAVDDETGKPATIFNTTLAANGFYSLEAATVVKNIEFDIKSVGSGCQVFAGYQAFSMDNCKVVLDKAATQADNCIYVFDTSASTDAISITNCEFVDCTELSTWVLSSDYRNRYTSSNTFTFNGNTVSGNWRLGVIDLLTGKYEVKNNKISINSEANGVFGISVTPNVNSGTNYGSEISGNTVEGGKAFLRYLPIDANNSTQAAPTSVTLSENIKPLVKNNIITGDTVGCDISVARQHNCYAQMTIVGDMPFATGSQFTDYTTSLQTPTFVPVVASVGNSYYATLAEAVNVAETGATITLLADASGAGIALWEATPKNITIDLGKHTYTANSPAVGSTGTESQGLHLEKGSTVKVQNGTISSSGTEVLMLVQNYCNLTLENVTLDGSNLPGTGRYTLSNNSGTVVIKDTTIIAKTGDFAFDSCKFGSYPIPNVTVSGDSVITGPIEMSGGNLTVNGGSFTDLATAVKYATTDATIKLAADATGAGIALWEATPKNITIDLGGHTYTANSPAVGSTGTESQGLHLEKGSTVKVQNGTISSSGTEVLMLVQNYCDLTLEDVTLDGSNLPGTGRYTLSNNSGTVVINDTTIIAKTGDFAFDSCKFGSYSIPNVTVSGDSVITGPIEMSGGNLTVNGGSFTDLATAVKYATTGATIKLAADVTGAGIGLWEATPKNITIDLGGHTYTANSPAVGSTGTESQGLHLEKGSTVKIQNGTISSSGDKVLMLVQNYCDLTLEGVTLDGSHLPGTGRYTLSNNSGTVVINDTTIIAKTGDFAFDSCKFGSYPIPNVTVSGDSVITGPIEMSGGNLTVNGGSFTDLATAVKYATTGATIKLANDVALTKMIMLDKSITIDLNGHKLSNTTGNDIVQVVSNATLTINGTTANSEVYGRINLGKANNDNGSAVLNGGTYSCANAQTVLHINGECQNSNVTISGATIESPTDNGIQLNGKGKFLIENSTITGATGVYIKAGTLTVKNSTITGNMTPANYAYYGNGAYATGDAVVVDACNYPGGNPTVIIESGTFSGTKAAIGYYQHTGGDATATPGTATITVNGGTFSDLSGLPYVAAGKTYTLGEDCTLADNATVPAGATLTVPSGTTLDIAAGTTLTNLGTIVNLGVVNNAGTFSNLGTVTGTAIGGTTEDITETVTEIKTAADVTIPDAGTKPVEHAAAVATVVAAVETVATVPNEALTDADTLTTLAALETKLTAANPNITASAKVEGAPEAVTGVVVENAALSVPTDVTAPTAAVVTVAVAATPETATADLAGLGVQAAPGATIIPLAIDLTVGDVATQPKAPLVIKLKVNMDAAKAQKLMIVHYKDSGAKELIVPTVSEDGGNVYLSFVTTSLSTFVAIETENNNKFEVTFTPNKTVIGGGDAVTFDVKVNRIAGTDPIGYLNLFFDAVDAQFEFVDVTGEYGVVPDVDNTDLPHTDFQFRISSGSGIAVPDGGLTLGTVTLKAETGLADATVLNNYLTLYTIDGASGISTGSGESELEASFDVSGDDITYRNLTVTFNYNDGGRTPSLVAYAKYNEAAGALYTSDAYTAAFTVPALSNDAAPFNAAGYILKNTDWHLGTATGTVYAAVARVTDATYFASTAQEFAVTVDAANDVTVTPAGGRTIGGTYYASSADNLTFTVAEDTVYAPVVSYTIGEGTAQSLTTPYSIAANLITGNVAITVTLKLDIAGVNVFTTGGGEMSAWQSFSDAYASGKTLVLMQLDATANYALNDISAAIYKLTGEPYGNGFNFAVLMPTTELTGVAKNVAAMKTFLEGKLTVTDTVNTVISYNFNANGRTGARVADVQAAYDFMSLSTITWNPTDDLLLLADVITYSSGYSTRNVARDGKLTADDIDAFLYAYAFFPKPAAK